MLKNALGMLAPGASQAFLRALAYRSEHGVKPEQLGRRVAYLCGGVQKGKDETRATWHFASSLCWLRIETKATNAIIVV